MLYVTHSLNIVNTLHMEELYMDFYVLQRHGTLIKTLLL